MTRAFSRRQLFTDSARASLCAVCGRAPLPVPVSRLNVFVWLRGGADALSLLVPYRDDAYYRARPRTALLPPGRALGSALPLTSEFALHPQLAPLLPLLREGEAAIVLGVGESNFCASHADAERALQGALERVAGTVVAQPSEAPLAAQFAALAALFQRGAAPACASIEARGWDTHAAQGRGGQGLLAAAVADLSQSLCEFRRGLGSAWRNVRVVVASEFGRSLNETALAGTDDGHASIALLLGAPQPASIIGQPPSLQPAGLSQARHLFPHRTLESVLRAHWLEERNA